MIEVCHSHINIHNYTLGDCKKLENFLSVWDNVSFTYKWQNFKYDEEKKVLTVPRAIRVNWLQFLFKEKELKINTTPSPKGKATFKCTTKPRDDKQVEAISSLLGEIDETNDTTERMLCLQTGGGKTYCTINALSKLKTRSIIIVDKEKIAQQWKKEFLQFTDLDEDDIYIISGSDSIDALMKKKVTDIKYKVFIALHQTLSSYSNTKSLDDMCKKFKIGCTVFDEAHCYAAAMFNFNFNTNIALTIYLTATPNRSDQFEDKVYQASLGDIYKFGLEDKFQDPYHNIYYISYNTNPTYGEQCKCQSKRGFNINEFSDYTIDKKWDSFYEIVTKLIDIALKKPEYGKITVILHKNDHIIKMKQALEADYPDVSIGIFCGLISSNKEREKELSKKIILSTDKSMGKAVDIENLQFVIMTVPTSSQVIAEQTLGRLRKLKDGRNVMYFDLTDVGFKTCVHQRKLRRKILDKKAKSIHTMNLN